MGRLDGKVCVITGAASGIGAESARLFAEEGARVVGVDLDAGARGRAGDRGRRHRRGAGRRRSMRVSREELGSVDVLFNNAGINPNEDTTVIETPLDAWQRVQDVNVRSVFLCCKHGIPHLLDGRRRLGDQHRVVRRGDGRGRLADLLHRVEGCGAGDVARAGRRVRRRGVRVNALCPGPVNTPLLQELFAKDPEKAAQPAGAPADGPLRRGRGDRQRRAVPRQRRVDFVTATTFMVDGGLSGAYLTPGQV